MKNMAIDNIFFLLFIGNSSNKNIITKKSKEGAIHSLPLLIYTQR